MEMLSVSQNKTNWCTDTTAQHPLAKEANQCAKKLGGIVAVNYLTPIRYGNCILEKMASVQKMWLLGGKKH